MSAFDNLEYELYAALALTYAFPRFVRSLKKGESPDWWDIEHGIGIEVARAENEQNGYWKFFTNKYRGKNKADIPPKELDKMNEKGETVFDNSGRMTSVLSGWSDGKNHIRLAIDIAEVKIEKLDSHYKKFNNNCLFLYMTRSMIDDDNDRFLSDYISLVSNYAVYFNHVFLQSPSPKELFHFDIAGDSVKKIQFSDEQIKELDSNVHELRKASSWDEETDFLTVLNQINPSSATTQ